VTAALAIACATTGGESASAEARPFAKVRSLALVRWKDSRAPAGQKDPLDALKESVVARGYSVRVLEVGSKTPAELRGLERLYGTLEARIAGAQPHDRFARHLDSLGADAGAVVAGLGVDAVATYHHFLQLPRALVADPLQPVEPPGAVGAPLSGFPGPQPLPQRPLGAVALVDRAGTGTWYEWGAPSSIADPVAPQNAAEAIEALVRVLAGEPPPDPDEDEGGLR
jgi:hypothetical protein